MPEAGRTVNAVPVGLDRTDALAARLAGRRVGLLANAASLDRRWRPAAQVLAAVPRVRLTRLFAAEHGVDGVAGPGEPLGDGTDAASGLPVVALYGRRAAPEPGHLADLDVVVADLPDVGVRAYTYLDTVLALGRAAAAAGVPVLILDRPNPLGRAVEGGCAPDLPLRHGLTLGEAARLLAAERGDAAPEVLACPVWDGAPRPAGAPWAAPSPNLPTAESAFAYAGTVLLEGTALSEGRGTARPFLQVGAPGLDGAVLAEAARAAADGCLVRPCAFRPARSKHARTVCRGIDIAITDRWRFRALPLALALLACVRDRWPERLGPTPCLDRLAGGPALAGWCRTPGAAPAELLAAWADGNRRFAERARPFLMYPAGP